MLLLRLKEKLLINIGLMEDLMIFTKEGFKLLLLLRVYRGSMEVI